MVFSLPDWSPASALQHAERAEDACRAHLREVCARCASEVEVARELGVPRATLQRQAEALGVELPRGRPGNPQWRKTPAE